MEKISHKISFSSLKSATHKISLLKGSLWITKNSILTSQPKPGKETDCLIRIIPINLLLKDNHEQKLHSESYQVLLATTYTTIHHWIMVQRPCWLDNNLRSYMCVCVYKLIFPKLTTISTTKMASGLDHCHIQCFAGWAWSCECVNSLLYSWVQYNRSLHSHYFELGPEPANQLAKHCTVLWQIQVLVAWSCKYVNSLLYPWVQYNRSLHSHNFQARTWTCQPTCKALYYTGLRVWSISPPLGPT